MPLKHQPDRAYLRKLRISRIHIFTGIQVFCLVFLWVIKNTPAAITFPLMVSRTYQSYPTLARLRCLVYFYLFKYLQQKIC